ncbi:hypothetical protein, partial [Sphingomonas sp.]|uniref:hypothetical protein n=1 Tax=Sphingomonas sp. TaxID=28214 RepID=UPI0025EDB7CC
IGSLAPAAAAAQPSLIVAKWGGFWNARQPKEWECDKAGTICLDGLADVRFVAVQTVSGPKMPSSVVAATVFHTRPRRGVRMLVAISRDDESNRTGQILYYVLPGKHEACFDYELARKRGYRIPARAIRHGDNICIPV